MPDGSAGATEQVQDQRRPPFCYQTHSALDAIRTHYGGTGKKPYGKMTAAFGVYLVFTEAANREGGSDARNGFRKGRQALAKLAGINEDTLDKYIAELESAGVLQVKRVKIEGLNLPNVWTLLDPQGGRVESASGRVGDALHARSLAEPKKEELPPHTPQSQVAVVVAWSAHAPPLIEHRQGYFDDPKVKRKLDAAVKRYGAEDVCAAVAAYAEVLASPAHFFSYRWTLADFLTRGLDRFVPEADPLENFRTDKKNGGKTLDYEVDLSAYTRA